MIAPVSAYGEVAGGLAPLSQSFTGRRVAITGGTAGLGLALVRELLGRGADVAFVARKSDGVVRVIAVGDQPGTGFRVKTDLIEKLTVRRETLRAR